MDGRPAVAQLQGVGVAEEPGAHREPARPPVAEEHGGVADVAAAAGLALVVDVRADKGEEVAAEPGEGAGDHLGRVLVEVDVDAEGLGRRRVLPAGPQPQSERGPPQGEEAAHDQEHGDDGQRGHVGDQTAEDAGDVRDQEPVVVLQIREPVGQSGDGERLDGVDLRGVLRRAADVAQRLEPALGQIGGGAEGEDVHRHTGDDVVHPEGDGGRPRGPGRRDRSAAEGLTACGADRCRDLPWAPTSTPRVGCAATAAWGGGSPGRRSASAGCRRTARPR
ncbi:hypothetical protein SANTM175S_10202 [Streptomyces antimycoticus]